MQGGGQGKPGRSQVRAAQRRRGHEVTNVKLVRYAGGVMFPDMIQRGFLPCGQGGNLGGAAKPVVQELGSIIEHELLPAGRADVVPAPQVTQGFQVASKPAEAGRLAAEVVPGGQFVRRVGQLLIHLSAHPQQQLAQGCVVIQGFIRPGQNILRHLHQDGHAVSLGGADQIA